MMDFFAEHYRKRYAPNTRETVRRHSVHQFVQAGLIVANADDPARPVNSPKAVYQVVPGALELFQTLGSPAWAESLRRHLGEAPTLRERFARERVMHRIPVRLRSGTEIALSPGGQNLLIERVLTEFADRFTPGGHVIYIGDTGEKFSYFETAALSQLGVEIDRHGKMPDVMIYLATKNWLVLVEAVTSHGPINPKRHAELTTLFAGSKAALVFVTAFLTRRAMAKYLTGISWETEVWIADEPTHLIHFNGGRFQGLY